MPFEVELTEAEFQRQVTNLAERLGWQWMHIGRTGKYVSNGAKGTLGKGWPDLVLVRGRVLFVELKRDRELPTAAQQEVLMYLSLAGQETHVWRPSQWALILETLA
jgi:hypothetical protein